MQKFDRFFSVCESIDNLFNWFGGDSSSLTGGGLYAGVEGKDACKNMILDAWAEDPEDKIYIANAIDVLKDKQLIELMSLNYEGSPLSDMPPFVKEFSAGSPEDEYFVAPDITNTQNVCNGGQISTITYMLGGGATNATAAEPPVTVSPSTTP